MKLNDLLTERNMFWGRKKESPKRKKVAQKSFPSNADRSEYQWHGDIGFKKKMTIIRDFLKQYPIPSLIEIYKSAAQTGNFATGDLKRVKRFMMQHHWDNDAISALKF